LAKRASLLYYNSMQIPMSPHDHSHCTAELLARAERSCAAQGARLTGQRREVLACVARSHRAIGAYDIIERMAEQGPRPAPITIYRALEFLTAQGLVHKIESRNAFVACLADHATPAVALLVCESCGLVAELDAGGPLRDLETTAAEQGFVTRRTVIELTGACAECAGGH
jgi:Fur family transcriptional regulator, zinc uptake regulator